MKLIFKIGWYGGTTTMLFAYSTPIYLNIGLKLKYIVDKRILVSNIFSIFFGTRVFRIWYLKYNTIYLESRITDVVKELNFKMHQIISLSDILSRRLCIPYKEIGWTNTQFRREKNIFMKYMENTKSYNKSFSYTYTT